MRQIRAYVFFRGWIATIVTLVLAVSCMKDDEFSTCPDSQAAPGDTSYMNLRLDTRSAHIPSVEDDRQNGVVQLRVFVYDAERKLEFTNVYTVPSTDERIENPIIEVKPGVKHIYVVANENSSYLDPAALNVISQLNDLAVLGAQNSNVLEEAWTRAVGFPVTDDRGLLMSGKMLNVDVPKGKTRQEPQKVDMQITRNVARLDINAQRLSAAGVRITGFKMKSPKYGYIFRQDPEKIFSGPGWLELNKQYNPPYSVDSLKSREPGAPDRFQAIETFYITENIGNFTEALHEGATYVDVTYQAAGQDWEKRIYLYDKTTGVKDYNIKRNKLYTLDLTFDVTIQATIKVEDWQEEEMDAPIGRYELRAYPSPLYLLANQTGVINYQANDKVYFDTYLIQRPGQNKEEVRNISDLKNKIVWLDDVSNLPNGTKNGSITVKQKYSKSEDATRVWLRIKTNELKRDIEIIRKLPTSNMDGWENEEDNEIQINGSSLQVYPSVLFLDNQLMGEIYYRSNEAVKFGGYVTEQSSMGRKITTDGSNLPCVVKGAFSGLPNGNGKEGKIQVRGKAPHSFGDTLVFLKLVSGNLEKLVQIKKAQSTAASSSFIPTYKEDDNEQLIDSPIDNGVGRSYYISFRQGNPLFGTFSMTQNGSTTNGLTSTTASVTETGNVTCRAVDGFAANSHVRFDGWKKGGTLLASRDITATKNDNGVEFVTCYSTLTTFAAADNNGRVSNAGGWTADNVTLLSSMAIPNSGSRFDGWYDGSTQITATTGDVYVGNTTLYVLNKPGTAKNYTARFTAASGTNKSVVFDGTRINYPYITFRLWSDAAGCDTYEVTCNKAQQTRTITAVPDVEYTVISTAQGNANHRLYVYWHTVSGGDTLLGQSDRGIGQRKVTFKLTAAQVAAGFGNLLITTDTGG